MQTPAPRRPSPAQECWPGAAPWHSLRVGPSAGLLHGSSFRRPLPDAHYPHLTPGQAHRLPTGPCPLSPLCPLSTQQSPLAYSPIVQPRWLPFISWNTPVVSGSDLALTFCQKCSRPAIPRSCCRYHLTGCSWLPSLLWARPARLSPQESPHRTCAVVFSFLACWLVVRLAHWDVSFIKTRASFFLILTNTHTHHPGPGSDSYQVLS